MLDSGKRLGARRGRAWLVSLIMAAAIAGSHLPVSAQSTPTVQGSAAAGQQTAQPRPAQQGASAGPAQQGGQPNPAQEGAQPRQTPQRTPTPEPAQQATPQPAQQQSGALRQPETYSVGALSVAAIVFAVLGLLFWLQLYWSNKLDQTGYLGTLYKDTLEEIEYKRLKSECDNRLNAGEYENEVLRDAEWLNKNPRPIPPQGYLSINRRPGTRNPFPPGLPLLARGNPANLAATPMPGGPADPPDPSVPDASFVEYERSRAEWEDKLRAQAWSNYYRDLEAKRARAQELSSKAINVDLSVLRGRGAEFVLGFTTIVAIVFAAVALGVLGKLDSQQIGTLFAAIAGYVLGRASATRGGGESEQSRARASEPAAQPQQAQAAGQTK